MPNVCAIYKETGCGKNKPLLRFCHIPALNGPTNETHFAFSRHSYFTADTARSVCEEVGGSVPRLDDELNSLWLGKAIHNVGTYVNIGWPFSLRWLAWPVSQAIYRFRLRNNFFSWIHFFFLVSQKIHIFLPTLFSRDF